jgi:hypothetical protein
VAKKGAAITPLHRLRIDIPIEPHPPATEQLDLNPSWPAAR